MATSVRIDITLLGDKDLERVLDSLPARVDTKILKKAMRESMRPVLAGAKAMAPVGATGRLKKGIRLRAIKRGRGRRKVQGFEVRTGTRAEMGLPAYNANGTGDEKWYYPAHVELGTSKMAGTPFLRAPFNSAKPRMMETMRREVWRGISKFAKTSSASKTFSSNVGAAA